MTLSVGTRLGPYEIEAPLGAGGMGEVYRARDTRLERTVAIKVLPSQLASSAPARQRFEREARAISNLNHPHICTLHDVGREGDVYYLVMEHLEGQTLASRLEQGALPIADVLRFGGQIAEALDKAHRLGLVHRDLKPGNIMITRSGARAWRQTRQRKATSTTPPPSRVRSPPKGRFSAPSITCPPNSSRGRKPTGEATSSRSAPYSTR